MIGVERTVGRRALCVLEGQQTILRIHLLFKDIKRAGAEKNAGPTRFSQLQYPRSSSSAINIAEQYFLKNKVKDHHICKIYVSGIRQKGTTTGVFGGATVMRECLDLALQIGSESCRCPVSAEY